MRTFVIVMTNKTYPPKIAHIVCAFVLLFCFVSIFLAQAFHQHENHNHGKNVHLEQIFTKQSIKACQICKFVLSKNQTSILTVTRYFSFTPLKNIEILHINNYVAIYTSKHLSLFSGCSPPITLAKLF